MRAAKTTMPMSTLLKSKVPAISAFGRSGLRKTTPQKYNQLAITEVFPFSS